MGNYPSEYYGATCYKCQKQLPPMTDFKDLHQEVLEGYNTHVFFRGQYYRRVDHTNGHQCPDCFWRPKREREAAKLRQKQENRRQREAIEQQRRESEQRQDAIRLEEQRKNEEARMWHELRMLEIQREEEAKRQEREATERRQRALDTQRKRLEETRLWQQNQKLVRQKELLELLARQRQKREQLQREMDEQLERAKKRREDAKRLVEQRQAEATRREMERQATRLKEARTRRERQRRSDATLKDSLSLKKATQKFVERERETRYREVTAAYDMPAQKLYFMNGEEALSRQRVESGTKAEAVELPSGVCINEGDGLCKKDVLLILQQWTIGTEPGKVKLDELQTNLIFNIVYELLFEDWVGDSRVPNVKWLGVIQVFLLELYCHSELETLDEPLFARPYLHDVLGRISRCASDECELLGLTQSLYVVVSKIGRLPKTQLPLQLRMAIQENDVICMVFIEHLLYNEKQVHGCLESANVSSWVLEACSFLLGACKPIYKFQATLWEDVSLIFKNLIYNRTWGPIEMINILHVMSEKYRSSQLQMLAEVFQTMLFYNISPNVTITKSRSVLDLLYGELLYSIHRYLKTYIANEQQKSVKDVIAQLVLPDMTHVDRIGQIAKQTENRLQRYGYPYDLCVAKRYASSVAWSSWLRTGQCSSPFTQEHLIQCLSILCCGVKKTMGYWPRTTQMISWITLLSPNTNKGRLLQIATGEGKSCINAMVAAMLAAHDQSVDIVTSSSVLAERDSKEWSKFYKLFRIKSSSNVNKTENSDKLVAYQSHVVYGTVTNFAADILQQEFNLVNVRGDRRCQVVLVDEVDFMLLDRGVQCTYLSHNAPGLCHLEPVLALVWNATSKHIPVTTTDGDIYFAGPQKPFYECLADVVDLACCNVECPKQFVLLAEKRGLLKRGTTTNIYESSSIDELKNILEGIDLKTMVTFFKTIDEYIPYKIQTWVQNEEGSVQKMNNHENSIDILLTGNGKCCVLYGNNSELHKLITDAVCGQIAPENDGHTDAQTSGHDQKIYIPCYLFPFVENRINEWVENAFNAIKMVENRDYVIVNSQCVPVDYHSTGMVELSKRWGGGLQQFLEMKHRQKISPFTIITNFMSNIIYFQRYTSGIFGVSGTLGTAEDQKYLQKHFHVDFVNIPCHKQRKLYEEQGDILQNEIEWKEKILSKIRNEVKISKRAALIICEDIKTATDITNILKEDISLNIISFTRSDTHDLESFIQLNPCDVVVATNLAGRGTHLSVSDEVNKHGGLFVLVSFLPRNSRIELQAFGRTGRMGQPGSVKILAHKNQLKSSMRDMNDMNSLKLQRDAEESERLHVMDVTEVKECLLREELFAKYCDLLGQSSSDLTDHFNDDHERKLAICSLHEHWGMWLQMKSNDIRNIKKHSLLVNLETTIRESIDLAKRKNSPTSNIYHIIKYGNEFMLAGKYENACMLYDKAIALSGKWSAIAYYNRAYCTIKASRKAYSWYAKKDLRKALTSLENYKQELIVTKIFVDTSLAINASDDFSTSTEIRAQIYEFFRRNIEESIKKIDENLKNGENSSVESTAVFSLVPGANTSTYQELYELWQLGLMDVFSVSQKPRFCWEGLVILSLGLLQVATGIFLTVTSYGSLTNLALDSITQGVSDIYTGVRGLITGSLSLSSWATNKATSVAVSIAGFGIGKLISSGFKATKTGLQTAWKEIKQIPKFLTKEVSKTGMSVAMKRNLQEAGKCVFKEIVHTGVKEVVDYGQDRILDALANNVRDEIKAKIAQDIMMDARYGRLSKTIECMLITFHASTLHTETFHFTSHHVKEATTKIADETVEEFFSQNQRVQKFTDTIESAVKRVKYVNLALVAKDICCGIQFTYSLQREFTSSVITKLDTLCRQRNNQTDISQMTISDPVQTRIDQLKTDIGELVVDTLSAALTRGIKEKVANQLVKIAKKQISNAFDEYVDENITQKSLTINKLHDSASFRFLSHELPHGMKDDAVAVRIIDNFKSLMESKVPHSLHEGQIIAEKLGVQVQIYEETTSTEKRLVLTLGRSTCENVQLMYNRRSDTSKTGDFCLLVDGVRKSDERLTLYGAIAKAHKPQENEEEVSRQLRQITAEEMSRNWKKWEDLIIRTHWQTNVNTSTKTIFETDRIKTKKISAVNEQKLLDKIENSKTGSSITLQEMQRSTRSATDTAIDHQPQLSVVNKTRDVKSRLAIELSSKMSKEDSFTSGLISRGVPSARRKHYVAVDKSKEARQTHLKIVQAIERDDPLEKLKKTFLASSRNFNDTYKIRSKSNVHLGSTIDGLRRLTSDGNEFQSVADCWYNFHGPDTTLPAISPQQRDELKSWLSEERFKDPKDPSFKSLMTGLLKE